MLKSELRAVDLTIADDGPKLTLGISRRLAKRRCVRADLAANRSFHRPRINAARQKKKTLTLPPLCGGPLPLPRKRERCKRPPSPPLPRRECSTKTAVLQPAPCATFGSMYSPATPIFPTSLYPIGVKSPPCLHPHRAKFIQNIGVNLSTRFTPFTGSASHQARLDSPTRS